MTVSLLDQHIGAFVGCASGDTLGMSVEGWVKEQINKYVGKIIAPIDPVIVRDDSGKEILEDEWGKLKYYNHGLKKGEYTDDTIIPVALAESIAACGKIDLEDMARRQVHEYEIRQLPGGPSPCVFGEMTTTVSAFKRLQQGVSVYESGVLGKPGNALVTKMFPLGLWMNNSGKYHEGLQFAEQIGRMTHLDPRSVVGGVVQAHAVYMALRDLSRDEWIDSCVGVCKEREQKLDQRYLKWEEGNLTSRLEWIKDHKDKSAEEAHQHLTSKSEVYASYPFALFMFQKYWDDPINGLIETVNYGGDCDTTGAMYGALCGAKNGMIFPPEWIDVLQGKDRLIAAAKGIYSPRGI
ncbi:MAG: ADP-ribosylglycohydrolase family protein [Candidatus Woesearchaeota archaeon]